MNSCSDWQLRSLNSLVNRNRLQWIGFQIVAVFIIILNDVVDGDTADVALNVMTIIVIATTIEAFIIMCGIVISIVSIAKVRVNTAFVSRRISSVQKVKSVLRFHPCVFLLHSMAA